MSDSTIPPPIPPRPRGRPPKYASSEERLLARRAQVREATKSYRGNRHAEQFVSRCSVNDAKEIIDHVINNLLVLVNKAAAHPGSYPEGYASLLQAYASEAKSAAAHLDFALRD